MIYFVRIPDGRIKIGTTTNFVDRLSSLRKEFGRPIVPIAAIPGWEPEEDRIHKCFDHLRHPRSEIFDAAADLLKFIENLPGPVVYHPLKNRQVDPLDHTYGKGGVFIQWMTRSFHPRSRRPCFDIIRDPEENALTIAWQISFTASA